MPHRTMILQNCHPSGTLRRLVLDNPALIRIMDREAALDELDAMLAKARRKADKSLIHQIIEVGYWVGTWPISDNAGRPTSY